MSMINDALRRVGTGNSPAPVPLSAFPGPSLGATPPPLPGNIISPQQGAPPLLDSKPARTPRSLPLLLLALFFFCAAGAAAVYLWERNRRAPLPKQNEKGQTLANVKTPEPPVKRE